jgi:hypothetical protein
MTTDSDYRSFFKVGVQTVQVRILIALVLTPVFMTVGDRRETAAVPGALRH